ncbi:response regulator transcription factor [Actinokineospora cianjurensis]|uniref:Two-component system OmpR family response regulator n=1 Tax=Actinokineospora cianjurensis TaxID=585224 RepID=A0A421BAH5_9PSEU|nr:response regulator transcription factor [Actinokineospora cianjurensis]RLK61327.1 two-component system OmpR family response regulator [Actinokineospora cianjurensis]
MTPASLLVVEDDDGIRDLLATSLRFAGFTVATAATGADALRQAERLRPDLLVLDVMLPDRDGFDVLRRLRAGGHGVPVLFLTARDANQDKVTGLTIGGDDYVTKPFSLEEVIARVAAILRRTRPAGGEPERLTVGDLELEVDSHTVRKAGRAVELSPTEFKLLHYLLRNAGRVVSKAQILDQVWNYDFNGEAGVVESYISYLRRKVDDGETRLIHTVRGFGYVLRSP